VDDPRDTRPLVQPGRGQLLRFPTASAVRGSAEAETSGSPSTPKSSGAELFAILWLALADMLGTAAAATLLRRAAQRAIGPSPELLALEIARANLEYEYKIPDAWHEPASEPPQALCNLVSELWVLLVELTGTVVVARLRQVPKLRAHGLLPRGERRP
jgi:hypothetical protein